MKKHKMLNKERKKQQITVTDLAKLVGTDRSTLSQYFNGNREGIRADVVEKVEGRLSMILIKSKKD